MLMVECAILVVYCTEQLNRVQNTPQETPCGRILYRRLRRFTVWSLKVGEAVESLKPPRRSARGLTGAGPALRIADRLHMIRLIGSVGDQLCFDVFSL